MDELTRRRLAHTEQLFREINDEVEARNDGAAGAVAFVCECSDRSCAEKVHLTAAAYRDVRRKPRHFVLVPGHEVAALERIVERTGDHDVVQKRDAA